MKIIVKRRGYAIIKPPSDIEKFFGTGNEITVNPLWLAFHRHQDEIQAVNLMGNPLEVGMYNAELTWQYLGKNYDTWFSTRDIRSRIEQGHAYRLVYMKSYKTTTKAPESNFSTEKCSKCKVLLYKTEEEAGVCNYCLPIDAELVTKKLELAGD